MSSLEEIKELSAHALAGMAECLSPDSHESPGAKLLISVRDSVVGAIEGGYITLGDFNDSGQIHEIADNAPSVYTHERWAQFADLGAYREEPESDEWPSDLTETAGVALYQIADRLAYAICQEWRDEWECPTCGGPGDPCDQDTCAYADDDDDDDQADDGTDDQADQGTPAEAVQTGPVDLDRIEQIETA